MMSENHLGRTAAAADRPRESSTSATLFVHVKPATTLDVVAHRGENRVVLRMGDESHASLALFVDGPDLDRLHALLDEASLDLGRPVPSAAEAAPEAYASGWDAAIAFCDASTDEPVPASAPGGPDA